jgi:SAM-dependent methyltransferase
MATTISVEEKYAQPEVIDCWQNLSKAGLQQCEQMLVARYLSRTDPILDIGCGTGRALLALNRAGYQVTGIDLSLPMLLAGRNLSPTAPLSGANVLALPFADGSFKAAFMFFGALQHIPQRDKRRLALAEMARIVQPGGRLILGLDNLAPGLICYFYWFKEKLVPGRRPVPVSQPAVTEADTTLWGRETRRVHPLVWHLKGIARTLRWRTWPDLIDLGRRFNPLPGKAEPGDLQVAQFSLQSTPGKIYYHVYRAEVLIEDAVAAGWQLLDHYSGTELSESRIYPPRVRQQDKQQFFAFERRETG